MQQPSPVLKEVGGIFYRTICSQELSDGFFCSVPLEHCIQFYQKVVSIAGEGSSDLIFLYDKSFDSQSLWVVRVIPTQLLLSEKAALAQSYKRCQLLKKQKPSLTLERCNRHPD